MGIVLLFLAVVGIIAAWWLSKQRLTAKPWLEVGPIGAAPGTGVPSIPAAKIGLGVFLVVAGALFTLFLSAYSMRMQLADWRPIPAPPLLWVNTLFLGVSSMALMWTQAAARRGQIEALKTGLLAAGAASLAFLLGQALAWRQLSAAGFLFRSNPADAFFYLLTAAHALHVFGGLVGLGRTAENVWRGAPMARIRLSIELCAIYWHFLLFVWLVLFGLMSGWVTGFAEICRQLVT